MLHRSFSLFYLYLRIYHLGTSTNKVLRIKSAANLFVRNRMGIQSSKEYSLTLTIVINKEEAQTLLNAAEDSDRYREECISNSTNAKARFNQGYQANSMTYRELKIFEILLENAKPLVPRRLKQDLHEVKLVQLMPSADGGMPHTRPGNLICYSDLSRFSISTLIHELWHVHQRLYEEEWNRIFQGMGWTIWEGELSPALDKHRRYNPDTLRAPLYAYNNEWVPVPVFKDISKPNLAETHIWFYNIHSKRHVTSVPEKLLHEFPSVPPSAYEHPRELTAYLLSDSDKYADSPGFRTLFRLVGYVSIAP